MYILLKSNVYFAWLFLHFFFFVNYAAGYDAFNCKVKLAQAISKVFTTDNLVFTPLTIYIEHTRGFFVCLFFPNVHSAKVLFIICSLYTSQTHSFHSWTTVRTPSQGHHNGTYSIITTIRRQETKSAATLGKLSV